MKLKHLQRKSWNTSFTLSGSVNRLFVSVLRQLKVEIQELCREKKLTENDLSVRAAQAKPVSRRVNFELGEKD